MIKLILVLVICYISLLNACTCVFRPEGWKKDAYCEAQFAGIIHVTSTFSNCQTSHHCYGIVVIEQLRGPSITPTPTILQTASESAACGVTLTPGHTYFVATNPIDPIRIGLSFCQFYEDWTLLSPCEKKCKIIEMRKWCQLPSRRKYEKN